MDTSKSSSHSPTDGHDQEATENQNIAKKESLLAEIGALKSVKACLVRVIDNLKHKLDIDEVKEKTQELPGDLNLSVEIKEVSQLARVVETSLINYQELTKREKRELENSVVSLTDENRDVNGLLRAALVEKEAAEKSLSRVRGNNEQKRVAILQIAEKGLQKVGFGFMMGSDHSDGHTGNKSDSSESDEEVSNLALMVEKIMKKLRLEIAQLRSFLEESRSETERLWTLAEKQAHKLAENILYIKELENREVMSVKNVDELLREVKETEEEVARWREACKLEVEAGKIVIEERDKLIAILKQELEKTKAALEISNGKLKLKEELAEAAMAAHAAAERSVQLADCRTTGLREQIEELTRQLEEAEKSGRINHRKVRRICWPWQVLNYNNSSKTTIHNGRCMLPEMQAFLH